MFKYHFGAKPILHCVEEGRRPNRTFFHSFERILTFGSNWSQQKNVHENGSRFYKPHFGAKPTLNYVGKGRRPGRDSPGPFLYFSLHSVQFDQQNVHENRNVPNVTSFHSMAHLTSVSLTFDFVRLLFKTRFGA